MIGQDSKRNPRCLSEPVKKSLGEKAMMREDKDLNGKRAKTLDLPSPSATSWDFIALQRLSNLADFVLLTPTPHCRLEPLSELPFCLFPIYMYVWVLSSYFCWMLCFQRTIFLIGEKPFKVEFYLPVTWMIPQCSQLYSLVHKNVTHS